MKAVLHHAISVVIICLAGFLFAQVPERAPRTAPQPVRPILTTTAAARALSALSTIRQKLDGNVRCLFDETRGHCVNVSGRLSLPVPRTERADVLGIATRFLAQRADLLALPDVQRYFQCSVQDLGRRDGPQYVRCQETFNGTPLYGAELSVAIDQMGVVRSVDSSHIAELPNDFPTAPRFPLDSATTIAMQEIPRAVNSESRGLYIIPQEAPETWRLAWVMSVSAAGRQYLIAIDAMDGSVVFKSDQTRSEPACTPTTEYWGSEKIPICKDTQNYYLYTGPQFDPVPFGIYEGKQPVKYNSWPPPDFESAKILTRMNEAMQYLKTFYNQISYCKPNVASCPAFIHAVKWTKELTYSGQWLGNGQINIVVPGNNTYVLIHELGHGMTDAYLPQNVGGYCDKKYPENAAIEEGLVDAIAEAYGGKYAFSSYTESSYINEYAKLVSNIANKTGPYCGAHAFGNNLMGSLGNLLISGKKNSLGIAIGLDILHLFDSKTLGIILVDTLRTKPNWRSNMTQFGAAMISTCNDNIPKLVSVDHCKNIERALNIMEIYPSGFYKPQLLGKQELKFPIDAKVTSFTYTSISVYGNFRMKSTGTADLSHKIPPKFGVPFLYSKHIDTDSNTTVQPPYKLPKVASGYTYDSQVANFSPDATTIQSEIAYGDSVYTYPFIDKVRKFLFKVAGHLPADGWLLDFSPQSLYDTNAANDSIAISIGPDFVPNVDVILAPQKEQPLSCPPSMEGQISDCPVKYHITIHAHNWGNKVTFPIIKSMLFFSKDKADDYFNTLYMEKALSVKSDPIVIAASADVALWKSGKQLTPSGKLMVPVMKDGKVAYPYIMPGSHIIIAEQDVIAKPGDTFVVIIDSPLPELDFINNKMTFTLPLSEKPISNADLFTPEKIVQHHQEMNSNEIINAIKLAEYLLTLPPTVKLPIPPDPIFDEVLKNPGETILALPDAQGEYPAWALPDSQKQNQQVLDTLDTTYNK